MSVYNELRANKRNNNSLKNKELVKNQKVVNIFNLVLCLTMILADILYIIKGNIVGVRSFNNTFMIISLILEIIMLGILAIPKFNTGSLFLKLLSIVIFTLPIIAYASMFSLDGYNILIFMLRILLAIMLIIEIFRGDKYKSGRGFIVKCIIASALILAILIPSIAYVASNRSRNANYSYDNELGGYVLDDVLAGSADININNNTVKIADDSLKNSTNDLTLPSSVKVVSGKAFNESNVEELHISSKNINIVEALNNSNVKKVYLEADDINILDIDKVSSNANYHFIASKDSIDSYREKYLDNQSMFIPKTSDNEYYVILNNTTSKILYFRAGEQFSEPKDVKISSVDEMKLTGWYYTNNKNVSPVFPITVNNNIELSAKWSKVYTFIFEYSGGKVVGDSAIFNNSPKALKWTLDDGNITLPLLEKENYRFDGWFDSNYNNVSVININMFGSRSFTAKFSKIYKVDYHLNEGYFTDEYEQEFVEGEANSPKEPQRLGYDFMGWYDNQELTGNRVDYVYHEGTSLYAKWELSAPIITKANNISKTYDGNSIDLEVEFIHDLKDELTYDIRWYDEDDHILASTTMVDAQNKNYYCIISINHKGNKKEIQSEYINVNIKKATYNIESIIEEYNGKSFRYEFNGSEQIPQITSSLPVGADDISLEVSYVLHGFATMPLDSGSVDIIFSTESKNYEIPDKLISYVSITRKELTIEWDSLSHVYDGNNWNPTGSLVGLVEGYPVELIIPNKVSVNVDDYVINNINISDATYYTLNNKNVSVSYEITKASYDLSKVTFDNIFNYDGTYHIPNVNDLPSGLELDSSIVGLKDACDNQEFIIKLINNNSNYNDPDDLITTITINPKAITAEINENTYTFNGSLQKPENVLFTGIIGNDTVGYVINNNDSIKVGKYTAAITINNSNYVLDINNSNLEYEILKANYDLSNITFNNVFEYDGNNHVPTINNLPSGLEIDSSILGEKNVCENKSITIVLINDDNNYNNPDNLITTITINPKNITAVVNENEFVYSGILQKPTTVTFDGIIGNDNVSYVITNTNSINAGNYIANVIIDNSNYVLDKINSNLNYEILKTNYDLSNVTFNNEFEYDGNNHIPQVSNLPDGLVLSSNNIGVKNVCDKEEFKIKLVNNNINYNDPDDLVTYITINPKSVTLKVNENKFTYNGILQKPLTVTFSGIVGIDTIDYEIKNDDSINVGNYIINISINNSNYVLDKDNSNLGYEIIKATYDLSNVEFNNEFEYDGENHIPSVNNLPNGLFVDSSMSGERYVCTNKEFSFRLVNNDNNYNDPEPIKTFITITPKKVIATISDNTFTYTGDVLKPQNITFNVSILDDVINYYVINNSINVGLYNAEIEIDNPNYELDIINSNLEYNIIKADFDILYTVSDITTVTYDKKAHKPNVMPGKYYTLDQTEIVLSYSEMPIAAGEYNIIVTFSASNNYNNKELNVKLIIEKLEITLEFDSLTKEYTGNLFIPVVIKYNGLIEGDDLLIEVKNNDTVSAGQYDIKFKYSGEDVNNYYVNEADYKITIYAGLIEITGFSVNNYEGVYDGLSHTVSVSGLDEGITPKFHNYYTDVCSNASVRITFESEDPNVGIKTEALGYVTISQKEVNVEFDTTTLTYNGNVQAPKAIVTGYISGDDVDVTFDAESINVGIYSNIAFNLTNSNYKLSSSASTSLSYEIVACHVTLVWGNNTFTYNKMVQKPEATIKYNGEIINTIVNVTAGNNINVGTYYAEASLTDLNYVIDGDATTNYNIVSKKVSLNWTNVTLYYNGENQKPSADVDVISGDICNVLVTVTGDHKLPNITYRANAALDNNNYEINGNNYLDYVINKGNLSVDSSIIEETIVTYDGTAKDIIINSNIYASDGSPILSKLDKEYINAGSYNVTVIFYTENDYYNEYDLNGNLIIQKYELGIEFNKTSLEYTGNINVPNIIINDMISGDDVSIDITNVFKAGSVNVGIYNPEFNITGDDSNNYKITTIYSYEIIKGNIDMTNVVFTNTLYTYDGSSHLPMASNMPFSGISIDYENSVGATNVSDTSATIYFTLSEALEKNWNTPDHINVNMVISSKELTISWSNTSFGYDGLKHLPVYTLDGICEGDTVSLKLSDDGNINRGNYNVKATGTNNINYSLPNDLSISCDYVINYGVYDMSNIVVEEKTFTYDSKLHEAIEVSSGLPLGVSVSKYTYNASPINVGSYSVTISFVGDSANYEAIEDILFENVLIINPQKLTISWSNTLEFTYDKESHVPSATISSGLVSGDECEIIIEGEAINAGSYVATATASNDNYEITSATKEQAFNIVPKTIQISVTCETKTTTISTTGWGSLSFSYDYDGKVHNDITVAPNQDDLIGNDSLIITANTSNIGSLVGTYTFELIFSNSNYTSRLTSGSVVINSVYIWNGISWVRSHSYELPEAYYTINGSSILLSELGYSNNVYYKYYDSNRVALAEAPTEPGTYYAQIVSEYDGLYIQSGSYMWSQFTLTENVIKWSYDGTYTEADIEITVSGDASNDAATFDGIKYTKGIKLQQSSGSISFTLTEAKTVTIYQTGGTTIKINGTRHNVTTGAGTEITLEAGSYEITKGDGVSKVYAIFFK